MNHLYWILITLVSVGTLSAEQPFSMPHCEVIPLPGHQTSLRIDGIEKTRWHFDLKYPRPFFYPFNGPSGACLTRMGHPGAPNHDHHLSVWFAHHDVEGADFWSNGTGTQIRQKTWLAYRDGDDQAVMACSLGWYDASGRELLDQELVAALVPLNDGEHALELQTTFRPPDGTDTVTLGRTNFGFLAVRVAKTVSVHFGGGTLTNSEGQKGERALFAQRARWMDYSGPVAVGLGPKRKTVVEGITYFDHPSNPRYPTAWHVREDGWMGASFCLNEAYAITADKPLVLRYLLHAHRGAYDQARATAIHDKFAARPGFQVRKSTKPHHQYEVARRK